MISPLRITILLNLALLGYAGESPAGRWEGSVRIPDHELKLVIDLAQDGGQWIGSAVAPGMDIRGAELGDIRVQGDDVAFTIKRAIGGPSLKGHVTADGTLTGTYEQGGNSAPFELRRTGVAQVEPPRHSTALSAEMQGDWEGEVELMGRRLRVKLNLANQSSGKAAAKLIVIGRKENVIPVDLIIQNDNTLSLESFETGVKVESRLARDAKEMTGELTYGPFETPLALHLAAHKEHS